MNQNQCVPTWDLEDVGPNPPPPPPAPPPRAVTSCFHSSSMSTGPDDTSLLDYEVAELTWENGQLAMHGIGLPRVSSKSNLLGGAWAEKSSTRASETLESIVNQAITKPQQPTPTFHGGACEKDAVLVPCFDQCVGGGGGGSVSGPTASMPMTMDALVPTANVSHNTHVGSCSRGRERLKRPFEDTCEIVGGDFTNGLTSTSFGTSPESTKNVTVDDHDSVCHSRPLIERMDEENENKASGKSSMSTKKIRAAAVHNQSERKRRDKINQKMKTLQKLVPNSNKTDKASMLDEVIDYLKQLQAQVEMMRRMSTMPTSTMMMQIAAIQQQLQMSMMSQMGLPGMTMGLDHINMGLNPMALARPTVLNPSNFMSSPLATWDAPFTAAIGAGVDRSASQQQAMVPPADPFSAAFFAGQSQPMTMDSYSRMAAMYQQLQHMQQPQGP